MRARPENINTDNSLMTWTGFYFDFLNPDGCIFTIYDIAQSLSKLCRFSGHSNHFYSVAQHSVLVSEIVPEEYALAGLLHDAAEAFIGDVPRPLKQLLPDYKEIEARVEAFVFAELGVKEIPECVKQADLVLLATERRDLTLEHEEEWSCLNGITPLDRHIHAVSHDNARRLFLSRYRELTGKNVRVA